jgi:hypothetical protein
MRMLAMDSLAFALLLTWAVLKRTPAWWLTALLQVPTLRPPATQSIFLHLMQCHHSLRRVVWLFRIAAERPRPTTVAIVP